MPFYEIIQYGKPYETDNEILGYADNEDDAKRMVEQCEVLTRNRWQKPEFCYREISMINYLLKTPR